MFKKFMLIIFCLPLMVCGKIENPSSENIPNKQKELITGVERLLSENLNLIKGKRLGIVTNHTAVLSNGVHLVDTLIKIKDVNVTALFGPEHGVRGNAPAGEKIKTGVDPLTGIPAYSLYGEIRKPTKEMLKDVDVLIFDIQDVGARFYTYISTLFYTLQAAAENKIPVIVLDRPNPINGIYIDGPIRKEELNSFVGIAPIPIAHGMTICELARFYSEEGLLGKDLKPEMTFILMKNWDRKSFYSDYNNLNWLPPSPNIPTFETALTYPGTCLIEGTNVAEGRGTDSPFLIIGAPFINSQDLIEEIRNHITDGFVLHEVTFTPKDIEGKAKNPKFEGQRCNGIRIEIKNRVSFESVKFGIALVYSLNKLYPDEFKFIGSFDRLSGDKKIKEAILSGKSPKDIINLYTEELNNFNNNKTKYHLYN